MNKEINNEQFEKDSIKVFENLLKGYTNAMSSGAWEGKEQELIEELTFLPTAPFEQKLFRLFDYSYFALSKSISVLIEKSLLIREQMQHSKRYVFAKRKYFRLPLFAKNTFLKELAVYNSDNELCYLQSYTLQFSFQNLLKLYDILRTKKKYSFRIRF